MCIIIDTNALPSVFKQSSVNHLQFKPVRDWILDGKGKVVFGGTKYIDEIKGTYLGIMLQLRKAGKAVIIPSELVDREQYIVEGMIVHVDFDDPHLVGLLRVSGCKLICSLDVKAYPFFRHITFFGLAANRPRIYSSRKNICLLQDRFITDVCKPCAQTTKQQKEIIGKI